jgi:hypothetical protein
MIFGKSYQTKYVLWFPAQTLSETVLILRIKWDIVINVHTSYVKYPLFPSEFEQTLIFLTDFREILTNQIL